MSIAMDRVGKHLDQNNPVVRSALAEAEEYEDKMRAVASHLPHADQFIGIAVHGFIEGYLACHISHLTKQHGGY